VDPADAGSTVVATTVAVPLLTFGARLTTVVDSWAATAPAMAIAWSRVEAEAVMSTIGVFRGARAVTSSASLSGVVFRFSFLMTGSSTIGSVASCAKMRTCVCW
jgi:hypothetical protein